MQEGRQGAGCSRTESGGRAGLGLPGSLVHGADEPLGAAGSPRRLGVELSVRWEENRGERHPSLGWCGDPDRWTLCVELTRVSEAEAAAHAVRLGCCEKTRAGAAAFTCHSSVRHAACLLRAPSPRGMSCPRPPGFPAAGFLKPHEGAEETRARGGRLVENHLAHCLPGSGGAHAPATVGVRRKG